MLSPAIAKDVIDHAMFLGANFAELFVEQSRTHSIELISNEIDKINGGIDFGIGIRLFFGTKVLYGYTNSTDKTELLKIVDILTAKDRKNLQLESVSFNFMKGSNLHEVSQPLHQSNNLESKLSFLHLMNQSARSESNKINQFIGRVAQKEQDIEIFNSTGLHVNDNRNYIRLAATAIAQDGGQQSTGFEGPGAMAGWEFHTHVDPKYLAAQVSKQALIKLNAAVCPSGELPVIIGNGFGGVIFHEACGHLLETTSVAKKASVFYDKLDETIANSVVNAVDDGTIANKWGSINIDDEGLKSQKTQLIKDGVLTSFLVDKMGGIKTGYQPTGSGRRESYKFAPTSRMRNTYIESGDSSFEEMISSVEKGIYAKKMGGGSVQPGTGEFNFSVQEAYLIEQGKISKPLKSATLISTGPEVLKEISMVGSDVEYSAGMCGSSSGTVPVTVGQPSLKVNKILVGGGNE